MGLDFLMVSDRVTNRTGIEVYPKFIMTKSKDLMIRGSDFYAIWDEANGIWSTEEQDAIRLIDNELKKYANEKYPAGNCHIKYMWDAESGVIDTWHKYCQRQMRDNYHMLDEQLVWDNDPVNKKDYSSKRLNYPLAEGDISAYDTLMNTLYSPEERKKIEWAIGSIVTGDSKKVQKFLVLYGSAGTGKSTVLNIIQDLFDGYYAVFDAKALGSSGAQFALEAFKDNPLVAIQHDGDLSRIEDNTRLNSLVSHELMTINEKFKSTYTNRFKAFLFMGTNKPVKITDSKSGLLRRLIDVTPTGNKVSMRDYKALMKEIKFELGAIACHCRDVYLSDPGAYDDYKPMSMMGASNDFYNYVLDSYDTFRNQDFVTLKQAWEMYKVYIEEARVSYPMSQRVFKEELKTYFTDFKDIYEDGDDKHRNVYTGFSLASNKVIAIKTPPEDKKRYSKIKFEVQSSLFDKFCSDCPAQYANAKENPNKKWAEVTTELKDIRTNELHYVKVPKNHIVIDFDIPGDDGSKSYERNLEEASKWPATYAELSKSGKGIHLHYIYDGDVNKLSRIYADHIEIKIFTGNSALRRRLTKCNDIPIAKISSGLPMKEEKKMINFESVQSAKEIEQSILNLIKRDEKGNVLNGHKYTTPNICFIDKILNDAYNSGVTYDLERLCNPVLTFAMASHNQKNKCVQMVNKMHFRSKDIIDGTLENNIKNKDGRLIFVDVEVYPNLFVVCWKYQGDSKVIKMINPKPAEVEELLKNKLVGFNCRRYDNHILYARMMGYTEAQLFDLSQNIIQNGKGFIGEAYNASYTDVYDYAAKKQSLKKWEIELGIHHQEMGIPWDQPAPKDKWEEIAEYCCNDVIATEAVFNATQGDWTARQILADLAGMSVNDTTNSLTTRIIFGKERNPKLVYTDLATGEQS